MPFTTRLIAGGILGVCLFVTSTVLWQHYSGLIDTKAALSAQVSALESDVSREKARAEAFQQTIDKWDAAAKRQAEALGDLTKAQREASAYQRELKDVLSTHDLDALARAKPKLVENRINAGTSRALRMLERATQGAPTEPSGDASGSGSPPARPP